MKSNWLCILQWAFCVMAVWSLALTFGFFYAAVWVDDPSMSNDLGTSGFITIFLTMVMTGLAYGLADAADAFEDDGIED